MITLQEIKQKLNSRITKDQQEVNALESQLAHIRKAKTRRFKEGETFLIVEGKYKTTLEHSTPPGYYDNDNVVYDKHNKEVDNFRNIFYQLKEAKRVLQANKDILQMRASRRTGYIAKYILGMENDRGEMTEEANYIAQKLDLMYELKKKVRDENHDLLLERQLQARGGLREEVAKSKSRTSFRNQFILDIRRNLKRNLYADETLRNSRWYGLNLESLIEIQIKLATAKFRKEVKTLMEANNA